MPIQADAAVDRSARDRAPPQRPHSNPLGGMVLRVTHILYMRSALMANSNSCSVAEQSETQLSKSAQIDW
jgi:hypothetical protein